MNTVIGMISKDSVDDESNQMNDFDEKIDQHSYIGQKAQYEDPDDSEFDDGGFLSDEVDERRSITPMARKSP